MTSTQATVSSTAEDELAIRRLRTAEEARDHVFARAAAEGWIPGALDHVSYFAADCGFFVGEVNGEVVACVSAVNFTNKYGFIWNFVVDAEHRNKGYGKKMMRTAVESLPDGCIIGGEEIADDLVAKFVGLGAIFAWINQCFSVEAEKGLEALGRLENRSGTIDVRPATEVSFRALNNYDTSTFGWSRPVFLKEWISALNSYAHAAVNGGKIVGYAVVRSAFLAKDGWRIGPLFADDSHVARRLFRAVFESVASREGPAACCNNTTVVNARVPRGDICNPDALQIVRQFQATEKESFTRLYIPRVPPHLPAHKYFCL